MFVSLGDATGGTAPTARLLAPVGCNPPEQLRYAVRVAASDTCTGATSCARARLSPLSHLVARVRETRKRCMFNTALLCFVLAAGSPGCETLKRSLEECLRSNVS